VYVKMLLTGVSMTLECRPDADVLELKRMLNERNPLLVARRQKLMLLANEDGVELQELANWDSLASYGIVHGTTVQLCMMDKLWPFDRVQSSQFPRQSTSRFSHRFFASIRPTSRPHSG
jgi:hypothetical protein